MAAINGTPIQHFRSRTTATAPVSINANLAVSALAGASTLTFNTTDLGGNNVNYWAIDSTTLITPNTVVLGVSTSGSQTTVTLSQVTPAAIPAGTSVHFQQVREGELFINTADNSLKVGGYPQTPTGNAATLGIIDLIPSIKTNAGRAMRVSDDGLRIEWGNVTAAGGAVNAVWAGQVTNPLTLATNVSSGVLTSPGTSYANVALSNVVTAISNPQIDGTWIITLNSVTGITVGNVLAATVAQLNATTQARVNLVNAPVNQITVTSTLANATPWGTLNNITASTVVRSGLGSSGIQGTGFVTTDPTVVPYMQPRNRVSAYAPFNDAAVDTGITSVARNPSTNLPAPFSNTQATVVDLAQGGFGIGLQSRTDLVNAAHPQQTTDTGTYTAKSYATWTANGFTAYTDNTFYYRLSGGNGVWPSWQNTNRKQLVSDGVNSQWQTLPQSIQNFFLRAKSNPTRVANKGIYVGLGDWLKLAQNNPADTDAGNVSGDRLSVRPDVQDQVLDVIQTAPMPIAAGGTGIDLRDASDTYWDATNNRLKVNIAWAIPTYGTTFTGEMNKITPPFAYATSNQDPNTFYTYVMAYQGVNQIPKWIGPNDSNGLVGLRLVGAQLSESTTFNNDTLLPPTRLEGLTRFGIWTGTNTFTSTTADGEIRTSNVLTNHDLTLRGSATATGSRLILSTVTSPNSNNADRNGLVSVRIDGGLVNVNGGLGSSVRQVAEDFSTFTLTGTQPNLTLSGDYLNQTVVYAAGSISVSGQTQLNLVLDHTGQALASFCGPNRTVSGLIIFQNPAVVALSKLAINITAPNLGSITTRVLRPLAGIVENQYVVLSWVATGTVCLITVATGD
jgi:hypothetical protein